MSTTTAKKPRAEASADRREELLEAAIRVISQHGMRGLTHRAVELEAGMPHGSTTYYFGTRHDLLVALMGYMSERGRKAMEPIARGLALTLADRSKPVDLDGISSALVTWIDASAEMELARYELQVTAARDPEMKQLMTENCDVFRRMCEPIVIACGSKDPERDAHVVQAALDGWMFDRLTHSVPHDETIQRGMKVLLGSIGDE
ncbi:MAG: TetR/AcrR family transcriptional regulator [Solirubrobacterales bacterium]